MLLKTIGDEPRRPARPARSPIAPRTERQLALLDAFADAGPALREKYEKQFRALQALIEEERRSTHRRGGAGTASSICSGTRCRKSTAARLAPDEEEDIHDRYRLASNSRRLIELATTISRQLSESDDAVLNRLAETQRLLRELEKIDPGLTESAEAHAAAVIELDRNRADARSLCRAARPRSGAARAMEQRGHFARNSEAEIRRVAGGSDRVWRARGRADAEDRVRDAELERLAREIAQARVGLQKDAAALRKQRTAAAPRLAKIIRQNLTDLGFRQSEFEAALSPNDEPKLSGTETLELLFSPNPGEPLKPSAQVASSGEISRVMLAIKSSLADAGHHSAARLRRDRRQRWRRNR